MNVRGAVLTNALLVIVILLLLANLALPLLKSESGTGGTKEAPEQGVDDDLVVRIPAEQAKDLGLEAKDIEGMIAFFHKGGAGRKLLSARLNANETAAIATLRNICSAQAQFQACCMADMNNNGCGEFGSFRELSGAEKVRGRSSPINPPVLSGAFRVLNDESEVSRSGYFFKIYLPGPADANGDAAGIEEPVPAGYPDDDGVTLDMDLAETTWCCYAWPVNYNQSGNRTFFTNQAGDVIACETEDYSGTGSGPLPEAAFDTAGIITANVDIGGPGQNPGAENWRQVN